MSKHTARSWLLAGALLSTMACAFVARPRAGVVYVDIAPPPPRVEVVASVPGPRYVWIAGRWNWHSREYVWVPGSWAMIEPGFREWVPGRWAHDRNGWYWIDGRWR